MTKSPDRKPREFWIEQFNGRAPLPLLSYGGDGSITRDQVMAAPALEDTE